MRGWGSARGMGTTEGVGFSEGDGDSEKGWGLSEGCGLRGMRAQRRDEVLVRGMGLSEETEVGEEYWLSDGAGGGSVRGLGFSERTVSMRAGSKRNGYIGSRDMNSMIPS